MEWVFQQSDSAKTNAILGQRAKANEGKGKKGKKGKNQSHISVCERKVSCIC